DGTRAKLQRVAECSVGIGKAEEQVGMLVVWSAVEHTSIARQDLELVERFVHEAELERRRLDTDAGCRAAERDRLELGNDRRQKSLRQCCRNEIFVRHHAF